MKHEVHLPQGTIRYREDGTGEPLLFVHGVLVNGEPLAQGRPAALEGLPLHRPRLAARLARDRRCRADADLSPPALAQMIVDFMDALGLETVTLVGNDTGGALCQLVATEHPDRVSRLVLTSCDVYDRFPPPPFKPLGPITKIPGSVWLITQSLRPRLAQRLPIAFGWVTKRQPEKARRRRVARPGPDVARRAARRREDLPRDRLALHARGRGEAEELRQAGPARVGERGQAVPGRVRAPARRRELPNATLEEIPDSYTFIAEDQPERLAEVIAAFVRRPATVSA